MSSKSKSKKNGNSPNSTDESSPGSTGPKKTCVVCSAEPSNKIVRDQNFEKVVQFYVEGLDIDVKPSEYSKFDLCGTCFECLVEFYDTNDVLLLLEKHLKTLRDGLISQTLSGIGKLKEQGNLPHSVHLKITQKWGDSIDVKNDKSDEPGSSVTSCLEDIRTPTSGGSPKKSPTKKSGAVQSTSGNAASASAEKEASKRAAEEAANSREQRAKRRKQ